MSGVAPLIVGIGGTLRPNSTSERALRIALDEAVRRGARTRLFAGPVLDLPTYDPARATQTQKAVAFVETIRQADGIIISSPSYHGTVSGMLKNALDYVENLRTDSRIYLADRAVGCIVCAEGPQALGSTLATLRGVVHALRGWPTPFSATINTAQKPFHPDGSCADPQVAYQLAFVAEQVVDFARMRQLFSTDRTRQADADQSDPQQARLIELTLELMN